MRALALHHEGAPLLVSFTAGPIKQRILELPPDDADLFQVWSIPTDETYAPAQDITAQFAKTWALECKFDTGNEPHEYLRSIPAFVLHHARVELIRIWMRRTAMPAVLTEARAA